MTAHYIDPNRGDNSDGSTWAKAYTDLSWMTGHTFSAGDEIVFAADADIQFGGTATVASMTAGDSGTATSPVLVYSDIPTGSGLTGGYARLRNYKNTIASDWTYDAVKAGWKLTGVTPVFYPTYWMSIAGSDIVTPVKTTSLPLAADREVYTDSATSDLFVYAPAGTDPVTYYGSVQVSVRGIFVLASVSHWHFNGLEFMEAGTCISCASPTSTVTGIRVEDCKLTHANNLLRIAGSAGFSCDDIMVCNCVANVCGIMVYAYTNWSNLEFSTNRVSWPGQIGVPQAAVYLGISSVSTKATYGLIKNNHISDVIYGRGARGYIEGYAFYFETGSGSNTAHSNLVERAHCMLADNSGTAGNSAYGNIVIGDALVITADAEAHGTRGLSLYNNTLLSATYRYYIEDTAGAAAYPITVAENSGTVTFKNNLLISTNETYTHGFNIANGAQVYTIESNALSGLTGTLRYGGAYPALDASNLVYSSLSLDTNYYCRTAASDGVWLPGVRAYDDLPLPLHPDIGAVQNRNAPGCKFGVGGGSL